MVFGLITISYMHFSLYKFFKQLPALILIIIKGINVLVFKHHQHNVFSCFSQS